MNNNNSIDLDVFDLDDFLKVVSKSFNINCSNINLEKIINFGDLADFVLNQIPLENIDNCTNQQSFYKIRNAFASVFNIDKSTITTTTPLLNFLPRFKRKKRIKELEKVLGYKFNILKAPDWITLLLIITSLSSLIFITIIFEPLIALKLFLFSSIALWIFFKFGNEINLKNFRELTEKLTRENYLISRRNQNTFNIKEVELLLNDLFTHQLGIDKGEINRETKLIYF